MTSKISPVARLWVLAAIAVALLGAGVWSFAIRDASGSGGGGGGGVFDPRPVSAEELGAFAAAQPEPIYWAGEQPGSETELTRTDDGNVFVRYLDGGAEVSDPRPDFLTIGTYPVRGAYDLTTEIAERNNAVKGRTPDGALVVTTEERPQSVYMAYPGSDLQIEVYHPDAEQAMRLATSGEVEPLR